MASSSTALVPVSISDKIEEKKTEPVAVKEDTGKKLALSFDMDGCVLTLRFIGGVQKLFREENKQDQPEEAIKIAIKKAILLFHKRLLDFIVKKAIEGGYSEIIMMLGSARQTVYVDRLNALNNDIEDSFALSSFPVLEGLKEALKEELTKAYQEQQKSSPAVTLDKTLLGDFCAGGSPGKTFDDGIALLTKQHGCWSTSICVEKQTADLCSAQKLALQYAQLHGLKTSHPHSQIDYLFFDDRKDILDALRAFYLKYPHFIPSGMRTSEYIYLDYAIRSSDLPFIEGTGIAHPLDPNLHNFKILFNFNKDGFLNTDFYQEVSENRLNFFFAHPAIEKDLKNSDQKDAKKEVLIKKIQYGLIHQKTAKDTSAICQYKVFSYALEYLEKREMSEEALIWIEAFIDKKDHRIEMDEKAVEIHSLQPKIVIIKQHGRIERFFQYQFTYSLKPSKEQKKAFVSLNLPRQSGMMGGHVTECAVIGRLATNINNTDYQDHAMSFLMKAIRNEEEIARAYGALCEFNKELGVDFLPREKPAVVAVPEPVVVATTPAKSTVPEPVIVVATTPVKPVVVPETVLPEKRKEHAVVSPTAAGEPVHVAPPAVVVSTGTPDRAAVLPVVVKEDKDEQKRPLVFPPVRHPVAAVSVSDERTWWQRRSLLVKGMLVGLATAIVVGAALTGIGLIVEAALGVSIVGASLFIGAGSFFSAGAFTTGIAAGGIGAAVVSGMSALVGGLFYYIKERCFSSSAQENQTLPLWNPRLVHFTPVKKEVVGGSTGHMHRAGVPIIRESKDVQVTHSPSMRCSSGLDHGGDRSLLLATAILAVRRGEPVSTALDPSLQAPLLALKPPTLGASASDSET